MYFRFGHFLGILTTDRFKLWLIPSHSPRNSNVASASESFDSQTRPLARPPRGQRNELPIAGPMLTIKPRAKLLWTFVLTAHLHIGADRASEFRDSLEVPSGPFPVASLSTTARKYWLQTIEYKEEIGRGGGIRTRVLLRPRQARYQAAPRPDTPCNPFMQGRELSSASVETLIVFCQASIQLSSLWPATYCKASRM